MPRVLHGPIRTGEPRANHLEARIEQIKRFDDANEIAEKIAARFFPQSEDEHAPTSSTEWVNPGDTHLHWAARIGDLRAVRLLLDSPEVEVDAKNEMHETPLHVAIKAGQGNVVVALLKAGASIYEKTRRDETIFHVAIQPAHNDLQKDTRLKMVSMLISYVVARGADIKSMLNAGDSQYNTPLYYARRFFKHTSLPRWLVKAGGNRLVPYNLEEAIPFLTSYTGKRVKIENPLPELPVGDLPKPPVLAVTPPIPIPLRKKVP